MTDFIPGSDNLPEDGDQWLKTLNEEERTFVHKYMTQCICGEFVKELQPDGFCNLQVDHASMLDRQDLYSNSETNQHSYTDTPLVAENIINLFKSLSDDQEVQITYEVDFSPDLRGGPEAENSFAALSNYTFSDSDPVYKESLDISKTEFEEAIKIFQAKPLESSNSLEALIRDSLESELDDLYIPLNRITIVSNEIIVID